MEKLPVNDEGYFLGVDIQFPEKFHNDLPFLPERMKIKKIEKQELNHDYFWKRLIRLL